MEEVEEKEEDEEEELDDADGAGLVLCTTDLFEKGMVTGTSGNTGIEEKSGKLVSSSPRISFRIFLSLSHSFLGLANWGSVICEGAAVAGAGFLFVSFVSQNSSDSFFSHLWMSLPFLISYGFAATSKYLDSSIVSLLALRFSKCSFRLLRCHENSLVLCTCSRTVCMYKGRCNLGRASAVYDFQY